MDDLLWYQKLGDIADIDKSEYGGAPLLGVNGITIIGHGRSNSTGVKNAIRVASELCRARFNEKLEKELAASAAAAHANRTMFFGLANGTGQMLRQ